MRSARCSEGLEGGASSSSVQVVVRARPPLAQEAPYGHCTRIEGHKVVLTTSAAEADERRRKSGLQPGRVREVECQYDQVLGMRSSQEDVWQTVSPTVDKAFEGFNVTLFTYGMTGSGKTHTMLGPRLMESAFEGKQPPTVAEMSGCEKRGLVPRVMQRVFEGLRGSPGSQVTLSYLQIYQERCYDLLQPAAAARPLKIREESGSSRAVYLEGLREIPVDNVEACFDALLYGFSNVAFRATSFNEQSSRAHCILTLTLRQKAGSGIRESKVRLVDLAGNERWDALGPGMSQQHVRELTAINKSLHVLGSCIQVLSHAPPVSKRDGQPLEKHVPYRDSALTMILRDSLSGNSFTMMVCTICSSSLYQVQTLCTLRFADRAKRVKMKARVCDSLDPKAALQKTQSEVEYLRSLVARGESDNRPGEELRKRMSQLQQSYSSLEGENRTLREQLIRLETKQQQQLQELQEQQLTAAATLAATGGVRLRPLRRATSEPSLPGPDEWFGAEECDYGDVVDLGFSLTVRQDGAAKTWGAGSINRGRSVGVLHGKKATDSIPAAAPEETPERDSKPHEELPDFVKTPSSACLHRRPSSARSRPGSGTPRAEKRTSQDAGATTGSNLSMKLQARARERNQSVSQPSLGRCPQGHELVSLGSGLRPLPAAASVAYVEWHCDNPSCSSSSARTPELCRFHCASCQHDLCQNCQQEQLPRVPSAVASSGDRCFEVLAVAAKPAAPPPSTSSAYAQPSRPVGTASRGSSAQGRRFRPTSANRASSALQPAAVVPGNAAAALPPPPPPMPLAPAPMALAPRPKQRPKPGSQSARSAFARPAPPEATAPAGVAAASDMTDTDRDRHERLQQYFRDKFGDEPADADSKPRTCDSNGPAVPGSSFSSASTAPTTPDAAARMKL
ncbi:unnamed protein product, partial [Polarella glacialis]